MARRDIDPTNFPIVFACYNENNEDLIFLEENIGQMANNGETIVL